MNVTIHKQITDLLEDVGMSGMTLTVRLLFFHAQIGPDSKQISNYRQHFVNSTGGQ